MLNKFRKQQQQKQPNRTLHSFAYSFSRSFDLLRERIYKHFRAQTKRAKKNKQIYKQRSGTPTTKWQSDFMNSHFFKCTAKSINGEMTISHNRTTTRTIIS